MNAVQMLTGRGGCPRTTFLTPDGKPFYGGTYFPPEDRFGMPGFAKILMGVAHAYHERAEEVAKSVEPLLAGLQRMAESQEAERIFAPEIIEKCAEQISRAYDSDNGGLGQAPKFPNPGVYELFLRHHYHSDSQRYLAMVIHTLTKMAQGGLYDHLGGGFHRYSVDATWLVPHFEKMLYDNALLIMAYAEAFQATGKREYAGTGKQIITYVLRDMTSPEGGFYSAEDADSEGEEGKFYLWTKEAIQIVLDGLEADLTVLAFNILPEGNFTEPTGGNPNAANIPHQRETWHEVSSRLRMPEPDLTSRIESARKKLFAFRETRKHPDQDDKV